MVFIIFSESLCNILLLIFIACRESHQFCLHFSVTNCAEIGGSKWKKNHIVHIYLAYIQIGFVCRPLLTPIDVVFDVNPLARNTVYRVLCIVWTIATLNISSVTVTVFVFLQVCFFFVFFSI